MGKGRLELMRYIINKRTDPYFNIALEEYCLMNVDPGQAYFILWQNEPSIIIGKNQNALDEINKNFVDQRAIKVVRRISGGGAVYHDLGNLNFTFISDVGESGAPDFSIFAQPVIEVLKDLGLDARLSGRNDILLGDRKISGNAQRLYRKKFMQHGTLMFDVNLDDLVEALNVNPDKIQSKGIKSIRSRVTNIRDFLKEDMIIEDFRELLQKRLSDDYQSEEIILKEEDLDQIREAGKNKFSSWEWNYGQSADFDYRFEKRFDGGKVGVLLKVKDGLIQHCKFFGDFLSLLDTDEIAAALAGTKYDYEDVRRVLESYNLIPFFGTVLLEEILEVFFSS